MTSSVVNEIVQALQSIKESPERVHTLVNCFLSYKLDVSEQLAGVQSDGQAYEEIRRQPIVGGIIFRATSEKNEVRCHIEGGGGLGFSLDEQGEGNVKLLVRNLTISPYGFTTVTFNRLISFVRSSWLRRFGSYRSAAAQCSPDLMVNVLKAMEAQESLRGGMAGGIITYRLNRAIRSVRVYRTIHRDSTLRCDFEQDTALRLGLSGDSVECFFGTSRAELIGFTPPRILREALEFNEESIPTGPITGRTGPNSSHID